MFLPCKGNVDLSEVRQVEFDVGQGSFHGLFEQPFVRVKGRIRSELGLGFELGFSKITIGLGLL